VTAEPERSEQSVLVRYFDYEIWKRYRQIAVLSEELNQLGRAQLRALLKQVRRDRRRGLTRRKT